MLRRRQQRQGGLRGAVQQTAPANQGRQRLNQAADQIGTRFTMKQRLISFGNDFWIKNERGEKVIKVDGKLLRLRDTLKFEDARGREIYNIKARMIDIRETMDIKRPDGSTVATVHNALLTPLRDKWKINVQGGENLVAQGNILQHEYEIRRGRRLPIAVVSKKWLRVRDTYGVELQEPFDAPLILAITVVIDMMSHNQTQGISKGGLDVL